MCGPSFQLHDPNPKQKRYGYRELIPATPKVEIIYEVELNYMTLAFVGYSTYMITEQIKFLDNVDLPIGDGFDNRFLQARNLARNSNIFTRFEFAYTGQSMATWPL